MMAKQTVRGTLKHYKHLHPSFFYFVTAQTEISSRFASTKQSKYTCTHSGNYTLTANNRGFKHVRRKLSFWESRRFRCDMMVYILGQ
jgi:hypothetical protein